MHKLTLYSVKINAFKDYLIMNLLICSWNYFLNIETMFILFSSDFPIAEFVSAKVYLMQVYLTIKLINTNSEISILWIISIQKQKLKYSFIFILVIIK
jgi:hypothetical protein